MQTHLHPPRAIAWAVGALCIAAAQAQSSQSASTLPEVQVTDRAHVGTQISERSGQYRARAATSATGMALSAQETPQAVSVITTQQMADQGLDNLARVLDATPGVSAGAIDRGRSSFSARGFGINKYQIDGQAVSWSGAWSSGEHLIDTVLFDRIEVVRGSTGLMNGSGDPSASVNLVRKRAWSDKPLTALSASVDNFGAWGLTLDHQRPLNADGTVRARLVAHTLGGKTFVDREKSRNNTLYAVLDADLSAATRLSVGASQQQTRKDAAMWGGLPTLLDDGTLAHWRRGMSTSVNWSYWDTNNTNAFAQLRHAFNDDWALDVQATQRRFDSDSELFYFSGNTVRRADGLGWSTWPGKFQNKGTQTNLSAQLTGQFSAWGQRHDVVLGAQRSRGHRTSLSATGNTNIAPATNFFAWDGSYARPTWGAFALSDELTEVESALWASARLRVAEPLSLIIGARSSTYHVRGFASNARFDRKNSSIVTPYLGVLWDITPAHTLYASRTSIFRAQSQRDIRNQLLAPIEGRSSEVGLKSTWLGGELQTQLSAFRSLQDNLAQQTNQRIPGVTPPTWAHIAAKGVRVRGWEFEATGRITPTLQITAGLSQWEGRDAKGTRINTTAPRKQFKVFASWDASAHVPGLTLGAGVNWQSRIWTNTSNAATRGNVEYGQRPFALLGLMARYQINAGTWAQLNIDNALDKHYINQLSFNQYGWGDPRTIKLSVRSEF